MPTQTTIDQDRLERFLGRFVEDAAAAGSPVCPYLGDRLGLYAAMADAGPLTAAQLAERTDTRERYVPEWLDVASPMSWATSAVVPVSANDSRPVEDRLGLVVSLLTTIDAGLRIAVGDRVLRGSRTDCHEAGCSAVGCDPCRM